MFGDKEHRWLTCSPDELALIDINKTAFNTSDCTESQLHVCSVEIKTSIADSTRSRAVGNASVNFVCVEMGRPEFLERVSHCHIDQLMQHIIVLHVSYVLYVACSKAASLSCTLIRAPLQLMQEARNILQVNGNCFLSWAYDPTECFPTFVESDTKRILKSRLHLWRAINTRAQNLQPFVPLPLFKHGVQCFYSKTKGGVDVSAQTRAMMRSPSATFKWEQKVVGQTLKTLFVSSFIAYRMHERRERVEDPSRFHILHYFRQSLNNVESLSDFCLEACTELLRFADKLRRKDNLVQETILIILDDGEMTRLRAFAYNRKQNRLKFFNSPDGIHLRLNVLGHGQKKFQSERWYALCGMNVKGIDNYSGYLSSFKCTQCDKTLCVRTYPGTRRSCWDM